MGSFAFRVTVGVPLAYIHHLCATRRICHRWTSFHPKCAQCRMHTHIRSYTNSQPARQYYYFVVNLMLFPGACAAKFSAYSIQHTAHTHTCGESAATRDSKLKYNYNATPSLLIVLLLRAAAMLAIRRRMAKVFPIKYLKVYNSHLFAGSALAHTHTHRTLIISFTIKYNKVWHTTFRND